MTTAFFMKKLNLSNFTNAIETVNSYDMTYVMVWR